MPPTTFDTPRECEAEDLNPPKSDAEEAAFDPLNLDEACCSPSSVGETSLEVSVIELEPATDMNSGQQVVGDCVFATLSIHGIPESARITSMLLEATERSGLDYSLLLDGDSDDFWYLVECCVDILRRDRERAACVIQKCLRVFLASHTYSPFAPTAVWNGGTAPTDVS